MVSSADLDKGLIKSLQKYAREKSKLTAPQYGKPSSTTYVVVEDLLVNGKKCAYQRIMLKQGRYRIGWICDNDTSHCMRCTNGFSLFYRRHHCRLCGYVICRSCSCSRLELVFIEEAGGSRVCQHCISRQSLNDYAIPDGVSRVDYIKTLPPLPTRDYESIHVSESLADRYITHVNCRETENMEYPDMYRSEDDFDMITHEGMDQSQQCSSSKHSHSVTIRPSFFCRSTSTSLMECPISFAANSDSQNSLSP